MTFRKSLFSSAATAIAVSSLVMGGCNAKDKGEDAQISVAAAPLGLKAKDEKDFQRYFDVKPRKTDEAQAQKALESLSLAKKGEMSWASKSGENGNYAYKDLGAKTENGTLMIGKAQLFGVHMEGDEASFDRADFQGIKIESEEAVVDIASVSIANPSPKMAQAIINALQNGDEEDFDIDVEDDDRFTLGAFSVNDVTVKADQASGTIDHVIWGSDDQTDLGDGKVGEVNFTITGDDDVVSTLSFEGASARGVNLAPYKNMTQDLNSVGMGQTMGLGSMLGQMNLYAKPYDDMTIGKFDFSNDMLSLLFEGFEGQAKESGGVTKITQIAKPMTFSFLIEPDTPQGKQAYTMLKELGFDTMSFTSSQTQVLDKNKDMMAIENGLLEMKDSFTLNYAYEAEGLNAMIAAADKAEANLSGAGSQEEQNMQVMMESLESLKLHSMKISLDDNSIVERGLKLASQMTGQSPDVLKVLVKGAPLMLQTQGKSKLEKQLMFDFGNAFAKFVDEGGTLTISMKPETPVSFAELMQSREKDLDPDALGFSAGVKP